MRLTLTCPYCRYWTLAEVPDGSGTIFWECLNCLRTFTQDARLPIPRSSVELEDDLDEWPTCRECGSPLETSFQAGGAALVRCSSRCGSRPRQGVK